MNNRYSLRKLSVGLCSVVLGCLLLQNATTQEVKADAVAPQVESSSSSSDSVSDSVSGESASDSNVGETDTANRGPQVQGLKSSDYQEETVTSKNFNDKFNTHKWENSKEVTPPDLDNEGSFTLTHVNVGNEEEEVWNGSAVNKDRYQIGQINLKDKIDTDTDFEMTGSIQLRNKDKVHNSYDGSKNGDGIGIAFHPGNPDDLGIAGGDLGIGGLPDAIGFKFDSYFNTNENALDTYPQSWLKESLTNDEGNGKNFKPTESGAYGCYPDDQTKDLEHQINVDGKFDKGFAGFVYTPDKNDPDKVYGEVKDGKVVDKIEFIDKNDPNWDKGYTRYYAHTFKNEDAGTKLIDIEGWHEFNISYKGDDHTLKVTYYSSDKTSSQSWQVDLDDVYGKDKLIKTELPKSLSLCITGSTGWSTNEQKIQIKQFTYRSRPDGKLVYIDDDENGKTLTPEDKTLNNLFVRDGESIDENNTSIKNGIDYWEDKNYVLNSNWLVTKDKVNYEIHLKHKVNTVSELKTFEEVVNYVDQNGNELDSSTVQKITVSRELKHDLVTDKYTEVSRKGTTAFDEVPLKMVITKNGVEYRLDHVDPGYAAGNKSIKAIDANIESTKPIIITVHYSSETPKSNPDSGSDIPNDSGSDVSDDTNHSVINDSNENNTSESTTNVETPSEIISTSENKETLKRKTRYGKNNPEIRQDAFVLKKSETGKPVSDLKYTNTQKSVPSVKANEENQKAQLPQTGDRNTTGLTLLGMLVSILGMAGVSVSDRFKKLSKVKQSK